MRIVTVTALLKISNKTYLITYAENVDPLLQKQVEFLVNMFAFSLLSASAEILVTEILWFQYFH